MARQISGNTITINWLRDTFALNNVPSIRGKGIYIIEKDRLPIYVGSGTSSKGGVINRIKEHYSNCFRRLKISPRERDRYKARIGLVNHSSDAKEAERIVVRTFMTHPRNSAIKLTNGLRSVEASPIPIGSKVRLELRGSPPDYLIRRFNFLRRRTDMVTRIPAIVPTYELKTSSRQYESFADSLPVRELQELEWV